VPGGIHISHKKWMLTWIVVCWDFFDEKTGVVCLWHKKCACSLSWMHACLLSRARVEGQGNCKTICWCLACFSFQKFVRTSFLWRKREATFALMWIRMQAFVNVLAWLCESSEGKHMLTHGW
jgi:hypothetical protein